MLYCIVLFYTVLYSTLLYFTLLYSTLLYSTLLYSTLLHVLYIMEHHRALLSPNAKTKSMDPCPAGGAFRKFEEPAAAQAPKRSFRL